MKRKKENPKLAKLIKDLEIAKDKKAYYKKLAKYLSSPSRRAVSVNAAKLEKICKSGEDIAVPGKVLGSGELTKPLSVYALDFSRQAKEKIEKSKGKCLDIAELVKNRRYARIIT